MGLTEREECVVWCGLGVGTGREGDGAGVGGGRHGS